MVWQGSYEFALNQWGVGHGGFHSQSLFFQPVERNPTKPVGNGSMVRVIYDCGSGRWGFPGQALKNAVTRMLSEVAKKSTIDLLVISHFDQDHVNGLHHLAAELRRKQIRVARVWAPMITRIEALLAITTSRLTGPTQQAYASFVGDPVGGLTGLFGDAEVTLMTPGVEPIPLSPSGTDDLEADAAPGGGPDVSLNGASDGRGLVATPGVNPGGEALWEIQPYVIESTLVGANAVSARVRKLLGKSVEKCSLSDLIALANDKSLRKEFHAAVLEHQKKSHRGSRTSSARTGPNLSSLCVYSGPVYPYEWCRFRRGWDSIEVMGQALPIAPAWFGTGDAGLLGPQHVDAMRTVLTQSRLDRVGISSVPHHGSRHDSGAPLWDALPNTRWVTLEADHSTGGASNHHPHTRVMDELETRNLVVHASTVGADFRWSDKRIR